jgi:hypothetical protein
LLYRISMHSSPPSLLGFVGLLLFLSAPLRSAETEVVYSLATAPTGSFTVAPYPAAGTNVITWLGSGSPGLWITTFSAPVGQNLRTVTLDMGDSPNPAGGFSLSLVKLVENGGTSFRIETVTPLTGSANPAVAGKYTYEVPPGIEISGNHVLLAQVAPGGGTYRWNTSSAKTSKIGSGGTPGFVIENLPASTAILGSLDLDDVVIFLVENEAEFLFEVTADKVPAKLSVESPRRFAPVRVGKVGRSRAIAITNTGGTTLSELSVASLGSTGRHFRVAQPSRRSLGGGESTEFEVAVRPQRVGRLRGRVKVDSSAGSVIVRLRGRGLAIPVPQTRAVPPVRASPRSPLAITGG